MDKSFCDQMDIIIINVNIRLECCTKNTLYPLYQKKGVRTFFELSEASFVDLLEGNLDELVVVKLFLILDFL